MPRKLAAFLGTTDDLLRLTLLRAVWFTPSVDQSDAGANWYRCDVVGVAGDDRLARIRGTLEEALAGAEGADAYGMCGTAAPDDPAFQRVLCREEHTWRAIQAVDLPGKAYPGENRVREAGQGPCEDAGREVAEDALDYEWGYEWPTAEQWTAGQDYGRCWAPVVAPRTTRDRLRHRVRVRPAGRRAAHRPQARDLPVHAARAASSSPASHRSTARSARPRRRSG